MEAERKGRGEIQLGGAGRGNHRPGFHWNKVISRHEKGRNKVSSRWGSGAQAEFLENPTEITIMILIII